MTMSVPVVLIHGLGGASSVDYAHLAKGLSVHRRCLLVDLGVSLNPPIMRCCATPSRRTGFADPAQQTSSLPSPVRLAISPT